MGSPEQEYPSGPARRRGVTACVMLTVAVLALSGCGGGQ